MSENSNGERCLWTSIGAGALGGLAGAFVMNQFQALVSLASKKLSEQEGGDEQKQDEQGQKGDDATVKTAKAISSGVLGHELTEDEKKWAGPLVHYSLGTVLGAIYGAMAEAMPVVSIGAGSAYGAAVWAGADEIAVPALGLSGPPTESPLSTHVNALAAHVVFGLTTGLVRRLLYR